MEDSFSCFENIIMRALRFFPDDCRLLFVGRKHMLRTLGFVTYCTSTPSNLTIEWVEHDGVMLTGTSFFPAYPTYSQSVPESQISELAAGRYDALFFELDALKAEEDPLYLPRCDALIQKFNSTGRSGTFLPVTVLLLINFREKGAVTDEVIYRGMRNSTLHPKLNLGKLFKVHLHNHLSVVKSFYYVADRLSCLKLREGYTTEMQCDRDSLRANWKRERDFDREQWLIKKSERDLKNEEIEYVKELKKGCKEADVQMMKWLSTLEPDDYNYIMKNDCSMDDFSDDDNLGDEDGDYPSTPSSLEASTVETVSPLPSTSPSSDL